MPASMLGCVVLFSLIHDMNTYLPHRKYCQKAPSWPFNLQLFAEPLSICLYQILFYRDYTTFPTWPSSNAISMQQVSYLCLLDLSSAFDTLDHSILLHRLSTWFGIFSVSLQWFTSYLSSRTTTVGISPHSSPSSPLSCGVPQGSVLGPVLVNLYTTPPRYLISASSISHLLYADDTQLFISFVPKNVSSAINNLQSTITLISSWMSSNYLNLNPLKLNSFLSVSLSKSLK